MVCRQELGTEKFELLSATELTAVDSRINRKSQSVVKILVAAVGTHTFSLVYKKAQINTPSCY